MSELVIHFLESMQVENDERELVRIADRPVEFFLKVIVEKAPVIKARQRIRRGIDLKLTQFLVLHQDRQTQQACGRQHIHQGCLQRDSFADALGKFTFARQRLVPQIEALRFRDFNLRNRAEKPLQELPAAGAVQCFERVRQELEERLLGGPTWWVGVTSLRHQDYRLNSRVPQRGTGVEISA